MREYGCLNRSNLEGRFHKQRLNGCLMAKRSTVKSRLKMTAVKVRTSNSRSGNPRRGWVCWDLKGKFHGFVDEGYEGSQALKKCYPNANRVFPAIEIAPKEYTRLYKQRKNKY